MTDQLAWPLTIGRDGQFRTVPEGSTDDIAMQAALIAATPKGDRPLVPTFGVDTPVGAKRIDPDTLQAACDEWIRPGAVTITVIQRAGGIAEQHVEVPR